MNFTVMMLCAGLSYAHIRGKGNMSTIRRPDYRMSIFFARPGIKRLYIKAYFLLTKTNDIQAVN